MHSAACILFQSAGSANGIDGKISSHWMHGEDYPVPNPVVELFGRTGVFDGTNYHFSVRR